MDKFSKYPISVYDSEGRLIEKITRTVYRFNRGRTKNSGTYLGVNYKNSRPQVYGDSEHTNGLYIFQGDYAAKNTDEIRAKIHANHVFDMRDIVSIGNIKEPLIYK